MASIEYLPNWVWIYKGEEQWRYRTQKGEWRYSSERHAKNLLTGQVMSVGSAQRLQRNIRANQMRPIPAERNVGIAYPLAEPSDLHGSKVTLVYNNLEQARVDIQFNNALAKYPDIHGYYISVYYAEKLEREQGTDTALDTNGYATLTGFYTTEAMVQTMEPWEVAAALQPYYTMNQYSRILVNGIEY